MMQTEVNLPYLTANASGPKHLVMTMTRAKLEQLTADLVEGTLTPLKQALADANLSASDINEVVMVGGMTRMPAVQDAVRRFFGKEPHKGVNPDEVVAVGAAIQAGVLSGDVKDILLLDVTPLSLSIETLGGVSTPQIERNTTIPTRKSQVFSTASDSQTQVEIHVLQGERPMAVDNKSLGKFILDGIPSAPRGIPQIEVTFDIDVNGILKVHAQDKASGRSQHITITASSGLAKDEVERMRKEAEVHAAEDKLRRDLIDARNTADNAVYGAEKVLNDLDEKVPSEVKTEVQAAVDEVKKVKESEDEPLIRIAVDALSQAVQKVGAAAYAQTPEQPGPETNPQNPDGENTVESEGKGSE